MAVHRSPVLRIRPEVVQTLLQPIVHTRNKRDLEKELVNVAHYLKSLDVFQDVHITAVPGPEVGNVDLSLHLSELSYQLKVGANAEAGSGVAGFGTDGAGSIAQPRAFSSCVLKNQLGYAETIGASWEMTQDGSGIWEASFSRPTFGNYRTPISARAFIESQSFAARSAFSCDIKGLRLLVEDPTQRHTLSYNAAWRDISPVRHPRKLFRCAASPDVVQQARASFKSSVKYDYSYDTRDYIRPATRGMHLYGSAELAGLGGDTQFVKLHAGAEAAVAYFWNGGFRGGAGLDYEHTANSRKTPANRGSNGGGTASAATAHPDFSWRSPAVGLVVNTQAGTLRTFGSAAATHHGRTSILDRFFAGGVGGGMRGYAEAGMGPHARPVDSGLESGDALGGDHLAILTARLVLPPPLPFDALAKYGVRSQLWAATGGLVEGGAAKSLATDAGRRTSVGYGFVVPLPTLLGHVCLEWNHTLWRGGGTDARDHTLRFQFGLSN